MYVGTFNTDPINVANSIWQSGVLSPIIFTVYLDELISKLSSAGIGCHFDHFAGILCYADDSPTCPFT